jgi:hypothetical protein
MMDMSDWHNEAATNNANGTPGWNGLDKGYMNSGVRKSTLPSLYEPLTWAHPYAVLPATHTSVNTGQQGWYRIGAYNDAGNRTFSSMNLVGYKAAVIGTADDGTSTITSAASGSPLDGLFLLSYADFGNSEASLWFTAANKVGREIHSTRNTTDYNKALNENKVLEVKKTGPGTAAIQYLRTMYDYRTAWEVNRTGGLACCTNNMHTVSGGNGGHLNLGRNHGNRPAMLLRIRDTEALDLSEWYVNP